MDKYKLILASSSPRRSDILRQAGICFEVIKPFCDENIPLCPPEEYVQKLSRIKCEAGVRLWKEQNRALSGEKVLVAGADTIVTFRDEILGKPADEEDAFRMLKELSGNTHAVFTGVTLIEPESGVRDTFFEKTEVTFYPVSDSEILEYIRTKEPMDKAGGYGIQGKGVFLVQSIKGDFFNVVGLPVGRILRILRTEYEND